MLVVLSVTGPFSLSFPVFFDKSNIFYGRVDLDKTVYCGLCGQICYDAVESVQLRVTFIDNSCNSWFWVHMVKVTKKLDGEKGASSCELLSLLFRLVWLVSSYIKSFCIRILVTVSERIEKFCNICYGQVLGDKEYTFC